MLHIQILSTYQRCYDSEPGEHLMGMGMGGGLPGLIPLPPPQNRNVKNTDILDTMGSLVLRDLHFSEHQHWNQVMRMLINKITTLKVMGKLKKQELDRVI